MATYSTDLTTRDTADAETNWVELTGTIGGFTLSGAGTPAADGENYIQGIDCVSQTTGKAVDAEISIVYNHGTPLTFTTGHVVFAWCFYAVGVNLKTKANDGWMYVIADSLTTGNYYTFGGSDSGRNPYGGWTNVAIDPTATPTGTLGAGGNGGSYQYFGHVCNTLAEIAKGTPSAVDAIRTGRGEISVTGSGGSFAELASYNDWNSTATPPGTSSTVVDSGYHRFGLFQEASGTYLWKGMLALGLTGTAVTFSDSNETIIIDDCPFTYADFNKVEVRNSGSSVTLNNITFISTASTTNGKGYFEVVDNAAVTITGCSFNQMGNFTFLSNTSLSGCVFNSCGVVTQGSASINGSTFNTSTAALVANSLASLGNTTSNTFVGDGTTTPGHAVDLGTFNTGGAVTINWYNKLNNGANQSTWEGVTQAATAGTQGTANDAIVVNVVSGTSLKISVASGATIPTVQNTGTGTVEITANEVTLTITVQDITDQSVIEGAMVYVTNTAETATYINKVETNASGQVSFTGSLGSAQTLRGYVRAATPATKAYTKFYKSSPVVGTFSNTQDTNITISLIPDE